MGEAVVGGLIGGILPALIALLSYAYWSGKVAAGIDHLGQGMDALRGEIQDLRGELRTLNGAIYELAQRVAKLEGGY
jgi:hypothetical protein